MRAVANGLFEIFCREARSSKTTAWEYGDGFGRVRLAGGVPEVLVRLEPLTKPFDRSPKGQAAGQHGETPIDFGPRMRSRLNRLSQAKFKHRRGALSYASPAETNLHSCETRINRLMFT